jgi:caffeoyl-CoA O-methyltransferase
MNLKYLSLNDTLYCYVRAHSSWAGDPLLAELRAENETLGEDAKCQISEEQGAFLSLLVAAIGARSALEIGTFTGYSSICIARGLPENGHLICIDQNPKWADIARRYWAKAGVEKKISMQVGEGIPLLQNLDPGLVLDFAFIDAAKNEYDNYYELILPRVRPNGLIMFDNMLWAGRLTSSLEDDPFGQALDQLNRKLAHDPRIETVLLPIADGVQVCRKK